MTKIHFYVDIWSRSSQRPSHSPLPCRDIGHILLWALHFSRESEHFVPDTDIIYFCYLLLLHTSLQDPGTGPLMLIRCRLNTVLVVNSVKIPNISRLSNWPLCHCEGIEDVLLTMTIINCNKFWFSTQWAFFTEQFELEANIPTPANDGQIRILVIVLSPEYLSSDELWDNVNCQISCLFMLRIVIPGHSTLWRRASRGCNRITDVTQFVTELVCWLCSKSSLLISYADCRYGGYCTASVVCKTWNVEIFIRKSS